MGYTLGMPWKETCVMNERAIMIGEYLSGDYTIAELGRRRGISRKTVHKWIERYQADPDQGLGDWSRAPHQHPNAISEQLEQEILEWKARRPLWGAPKIHSKLLARTDCPAESTVSNVLKRHGLTRRVRRRHRATANAGLLQHLQGPNEVWCVDFKGWFRLGNGQRCDPLTISDAYSRYVMCCQGLSGFTGVSTVQPLFEVTFREYGLPVAIRSDNGAPFASVGLAGLSRLSVWWLQLGIQLERIQPGHPEQNGRHERFHRTLKEAVLQPPQRNLQRQQAAFDRFCQEYNEERPHEALNQHPPSCVYVPSARDYPTRLAPPEYPDAWQKRSVRSNGEIKWRGAKVYLTQALIGQWVGLEPVGHGAWDVYFMSQRLGRLDERRGRVEPIRTTAT
jgi:putative transposase